MTLKVSLVHGHVFQAHDALQPLHFDDGVHKKERIAVRQDLLYFDDIHDHFAVSVAAHPLGGAWHIPGETLIISEPQTLRYALFG